MNQALSQYVELIEGFVHGRVSLSEFEVTYLDKFKHETQPFSASVFDVLDSLFANVDAFCADPDLRDEDDIDETELRRVAELALAKLVGAVNDA